VIFLSSHRVQTGFGANPPSLLFNEYQRLLPGGEADHSSPSSADVKNAWSYISVPSICLYGVVFS